MKKVLIASGVAVLAFAMVAGAAGAFNTNLTVGSTGADVVALQTALVNAKYLTMPAGVAMGYFGSRTQAAVKLFQAANGVPNTGFVGPLTRGVLNGTTAAPVAVACPVGYTCTANPGTTPVVVTPSAPLAMDGTDGSLTVSLSSYAGNVTAKKGDTKDVVAVKLQATAAPVAVTRFDVRMDKRPWLYFSKITLKDSSGTVIATKNISSAADATEITVATDYLVRFEGINYTVTPGSDKILVVSATVLAATDKLTSDVSVNVAVPSASIRTINGKGYTDSLGISGTNFTAGTTGRLVTLSSTGSTGNILVRISPNTPAQRIVNTSTSGETKDVVLGVFDFKSENQPSKLNTLTFTLKDNGGNKTFSTVYKNLRLVDGSTQYNVDSVATSSVFSNLIINLAQDEWKSLKIVADVADQDDFVNGMMGSTTITTVNLTNPVGTDVNDNAVTSTVTTVTSNDFTFLKNGASVSAMSASPVAYVGNGPAAPVKASIGFTFTFNNTGTNDLYIAKDANVALGTTTAGFAATTTQPWPATTVSAATVAGDTATMYIIPSGTSRTFVNQSVVDTTRDSSVKTGSVKISSVYFTDLTNIASPRTYSITFGLEPLQTTLITF